MSINTDFYGSENDWIALSRDTPDLFKTAYPYNNDATYQGSLKAFQESSITNPENVASPKLDDSIIPWKINEKSDVFNQKYIYPYCIDYTNPQQSTWMYQSSDYTQNVNGGFRFFIQDANTTNGNNGPNGVWVYRYSPLNTKGQLDEGLYRRLFPIVGFDYSKCYVQIFLLYVPKSAFDDITKTWTAATVDKMSIKDIIDDDSKWENNYFYGIQYELRYKGLTGNAHSLGLFAYDKIKASPYSGGYYPYGEDYNHYQTAMTVVHDAGQMGQAQIGGIVGGSGNAFTIRWDSTTHTDIIDLFKKNYDDTHCLRHMGGLKDGEQIVFNRQSGTNAVRLIPYRTYDSDSKQDFIEYARKQAAYLGFPFSDYAYNMIDNPDKTYIPEINASGVTTGNYALANTQPEYINADWTTDVYNKTPYNPENDKADDPNIYDDNKTVLNTLSTIYDRFTNEYILNGTQLLALKNELYTTISSDVDSSFWSSQKFLTNNPLDVVKGLTFYPFDVANKAPNTGTLDYDHIVLGTIDTGVSATALNDSFIVIDCGSCTYFPVYGVNDFRSYAPYSTAELHIPYCGSVEISPELYLNHVISVKMIVDLKTGAALALIYRDGMVVDSVGGTVGITIPISGIERETLAAAEHQALSQYKTARNTAIGNIASFALDNKNLISNVGSFGIVGAAMSAGSMLKKSGQAANVANSLQNVEDAQYDLQHIEVPYKTIGTASSVTSYANEPYCRLIIKRPIMLDGYSQSDFGHCYGFATNKTGVVSDFSGYTQFASVDLSGVNCSESMKAQIKSIMLSGVRI
jgi:hypothetical protein